MRPKGCKGAKGILNSLSEFALRTPEDAERGAGFTGIFEIVPADKAGGVGVEKEIRPF